MEFEPVRLEETKKIEDLSLFASSIIRVYYDPIIGKKQNDYHLKMFQSVEGITRQLRDGVSYYLLKEGGNWIGFLAFYPRKDSLYLSKFYFHEDHRGKGHGREAIAFLKEQAKAMDRSMITLNVNRFNPSTHVYEHLGFRKLRQEQVPVGEGFIMDDFVYGLAV